MIFQVNNQDLTVQTRYEAVAGAGRLYLTPTTPASVKLLRSAFPSATCSRKLSWGEFERFGGVKVLGLHFEAGEPFVMIPQSKPDHARLTAIYPGPGLKNESVWIEEHPQNGAAVATLMFTLTGASAQEAKPKAVKPGPNSPVILPAPPVEPVSANLESKSEAELQELIVVAGGKAPRGAQKTRLIALLRELRSKAK